MTGQQTYSPEDLVLLPDVLDYIFADRRDALNEARASEFAVSAPNSSENAAMVFYHLLCGVDARSSKL
jgi:hypothetical protein